LGEFQQTKSTPAKRQ